MQKNIKVVTGWEEWCALPRLGLPAIKAKLDTGARTSTLHAFDIEAFKQEGKHFVRFKTHPLPKNNQLSKTCVAPLVGERQITNSFGQQELRFVIETPISIAEQEWMIEITLTNRDLLGFRMLLGRAALAHHILLDPSLRSYLGRPTRQQLKKMYL